jgi:hypothetical protein
MHELIGRRVINVWRRPEGYPPEAYTGTVTAVELALYSGVRVLFDGQTEPSCAMCPSDLALVDTYPAPGSRLSDILGE